MKKFTPSAGKSCRRLWPAVAIAVAAGTAGARAAVLEESFDSAPWSRGWAVHGAAELFQWDAVNGAVEATWDSARSNSFCALPLGVVLGRRDDFEFGFDLELLAHQAGPNPVKPGTFQISVGLLNLSEATSPSFVRASGTGSPDLVEWAWFGADSTISASVSPVITSTNHPPRWAFRDSYVSLETGPRYRFTLGFTAADSTLRLAMTIDGVAGPSLEPVVLPPSFTDFAVDAFSITSYSDAGQDPHYAGSVLAKGRIDNVRLVLPDPPVSDLRFIGGGAAPREVEFGARKGWSYYLEATAGFETWSTVSGPEPGATGRITMRDTRKALLPLQFYRIRAERD